VWYSGGDGHAYGPETFTVEEKKKKFGPRNVERGWRPENITWMGPILPTYLYSGYLHSSHVTAVVDRYRVVAPCSVLIFPLRFSRLLYLKLRIHR